jgi:hypothetical protein
MLLTKISNYERQIINYFLLICITKHNLYSLIGAIIFN